MAQIKAKVDGEWVELPIKVIGVGGGEEPTYDDPTIDVSAAGLITASANGKSATQQLSTQAAKTVTPTTSEQTAVASGKYTTGEVKVGAIPSNYIVPSGSQTFTENGTYDVADIASAVVNVESSSGMNVQAYHGTGTAKSSSYTSTGVMLTVAKSGTYKVSWMAYRSSNRVTGGTQLYVTNMFSGAYAAYGSASTTWTNTYGQSVVLTGVALTAGQKVCVYANSTSTSYAVGVGNLVIEQTA